METKLFKSIFINLLSSFMKSLINGSVYNILQDHAVLCLKALLIENQSLVKMLIEMYYQQGGI
jgi:hypothetical protein